MQSLLERFDETEGIVGPAWLARYITVYVADFATPAAG
jgi:hypothetical protein